MKIEIRNAQNLSYREKQVVTLKESGVPAAKIAHQLNLAESTIATLYNRARAKGYETVIILPGEILALYENYEGSDE